MTTALSETAARDVLAALSAATIPDTLWIVGDDLCDCTFQRIAEWTNPYIGATKRVRLCCIWAELERAYPQHVQEIPAYYDENRHRYVTEPRAWDSEEMPMPVSFWHRQLARQTGKTLAQIREEYAGREHERPQPVPPGTVVKDVPTEQELHDALEARLRAATWILPSEKLA